MTRWERFMFNRVPHSRFDGGAPLSNDPDMQDAVSEELIDKVANNGDTTKRLVARMYISNNLAHKDIQADQRVQGIKLKWHERIIWAIFILLFGGLITGAIGFIYWLPKFLVERIIGG